MPTLRYLASTVASLCWVLVSTVSSMSRADRGVCGPTCCQLPHLPGNDVNWAFEPSQRAVILWNGTEEILLLATDLSHPTAGTLNEMIALPSEPTARMGDPATFAKLAALATARSPTMRLPVPTATAGQMFDVQVLPAEALGAIPPGQNARIRHHETGVTEPICLALTAHLKSRGFHWVVADQVSLSSQVQSFPPVEYRFKTSHAFYPLELSKQNRGETRIDLVVISPQRLSHFSDTVYPAEHLGSFQIESKELQKLSPDWPAFFVGFQSVVVEHVRMTGDIRQMVRDFCAD